MALNQGLGFKKLDLHIHTPASSDFKGTVQPNEIVDKALSKGLSGIAITDHNSGDWVDKVKAAAKGKEVTIFPGAELTCAGGEKNIHVIALFDVDKNTDHVNGMLSALNIKPEQRGKEDALINKAITEVIDTIDQWGGIAVLAHVNSTSGVFCDMKGQQRIAIIQHPKLLAVEATDFQNEKKAAEKKRAIDLLNGKDPEYKTKLAVYQASDNPHQGGGHSLDGIGARSTYFKLETVNLNGLYQCFSDSDVRVVQEFEFEDKSYPRVKAMTISGGFLGGQTVTFHQGLNSILGGKGTGKSLIVELLRFGLNQPPTQADIFRDHQGKLETRLGAFEHVEIQCLDETGNELKVKRTRNPVEGDPFEGIQYDPAQVFPVLFLSQNEIIKVAENEAEQLVFIDRFFDFRTYKQKIKRIEDELGVLDKKMAESLRAFSEVDSLTEQIKTLEEELKRLDTALNHPVFDNYKLLAQKESSFQQQEEYLETLDGNIQKASSGLKDYDLPPVPEDLKSDGALLRNLETLKRYRDKLETDIGLLEKAAREAKQAIKREVVGWQPTLASGKAEYEKHIQQSGGDTPVLALQRDQKAKALDELNKQLMQETKKKDAITEISAKREKLLNDLENTYREYTARRREKTDKFQRDSAGRLKLSIVEASNVDIFKATLHALKRGSYLKDMEVDEICGKVKPREFILAILRYASTDQKQTKPLAEIATKAGVSLDRMQTLAGHLLAETSYEELLALQYKATPQDRPEILFNAGASADDYRPLHEVSVGQKSVALLIMALSDGKMPVVIDQPEDSLDIRSIWEDVCMKLRKGKTTRQFISTTHSSSVAVASDSDKFIILEGDASKGKILFSGSMDDEPVSEEVLKYLEGGIIAYRRKHMKYRADRKLTQKQN